MPANARPSIATGLTGSSLVDGSVWTPATLGADVGATVGAVVGAKVGVAVTIWPALACSATASSA